MQPPVHDSNSYFHTIYRDPDHVIKTAKNKLRGIKFDTFVGTGVSGAVAVPLLARAMRKHWMIVRKSGDSTHSSRVCEGRMGTRWIFLDDLISSGSTVRRVYKDIQYHLPHAVMVGAYTYQEAIICDPPRFYDIEWFRTRWGIS